MFPELQASLTSGPSSLRRPFLLHVIIRLLFLEVLLFRKSQV